MKFFSNISIRYKIIFVGISIVLVFLVIVFGYLFPNMENNIVGMKKIKLKEITRTAHSIVSHYYLLYTNGEMSESEARQNAINTIKDLRYGPESKDYVWINDFQPKMVMHPYVKSLNGQDLSDYRDPNGFPLFVEMVKVCKEKGEGYVEYMWQWKDNKDKIVPKISYVMTFEPWNWILGTGLYAMDAQGEIEILQGAMQERILLMFIATGILAVLFLYLISKSISNPIKRIMKFAQKLAKGELDERIAVNSRDEIGVLAVALNESVNQIEKLIIDIQNSVLSINKGINEIADGNTNLSNRVSSQASALEEIVATIEEFHASLKKNDENTDVAHKLSVESSSIAQEGGTHVEDAIRSINEVNQSSEKIQEIVSLINDISFQINLLALNAAIEAARAGEYGRGFSVVAGEVRNLAQRSAKAAKDIASLVGQTLVKIDRGAELSTNSGKSLKDIIVATENVLNVVSQLSLSFTEQKTGMEQIATAISDIDTMTQENASLVEETASASENMTYNAGELMKMVQHFKVKKI